MSSVIGAVDEEEVTTKASVALMFSCWRARSLVVLLLGVVLLDMVVEVVFLFLSKCFPLREGKVDLFNPFFSVAFDLKINV